MRFLLLSSLLLASCGPKTVYTDADVPRLEKLDDLMWAQAQSTDPQFKKIGKAAYSDEDFAAFASVSSRLKLTAERIKQAPFSKGDGFNQVADKMAGHADELATAATAKDPAKSSAALQAIKDTCKSCHKQFR